MTGELVSDFSQWDAKRYLDEFYTGEISTSERTSLDHLVGFLKGKGTHFDTAIDIGSGPTLHQIIPLVPYVGKMHLSDFLPQNLEEIQKWLKGDPNGHNWDRYIHYVLNLEGNGESIDCRKDAMRSAVTRLLPVDIKSPHPLGMSAVTYPLVTSFYCADSITPDKREWRQCMENIFTIVEPGGLIIVEALRNSDHYAVAGKRFPSAHVTEVDVEEVFTKSGQFVESSIEIAVMPNPEWAESGFDAMIRATAQKIG